VKFRHIKFHGNSSIGSRAGTYGQTEGRTWRYYATPHLQNYSMERDSIWSWIRL